MKSHDLKNLQVKDLKTFKHIEKLTPFYVKSKEIKFVTHSCREVTTRIPIYIYIYISRCKIQRFKEFNHYK